MASNEEVEVLPSGLPEEDAAPASAKLDPEWTKRASSKLMVRRRSKVHISLDPCG